MRTWHQKYQYRLVLAQAHHRRFTHLPPLLRLLYRYQPFDQFFRIEHSDFFLPNRRSERGNVSGHLCVGDRADDSETCFPPYSLAENILEHVDVNEDVHLASNRAAIA